MPTPPLPVLHALLSALALRRVLYPSSLSSVPPTLVLLVLECLLGRRLPLPSTLRSPRTRNAEIELSKIILGSLADDILSLDLTVVDPERLVDGSEPDIAVVIMALAVAAQRRGIVMRLPSEVPEEECDISWESINSHKSLLDEAEDEELPLAEVQPLEPVRSLPMLPTYMVATPPRLRREVQQSLDFPTPGEHSTILPADTSTCSPGWTAALDLLARTPSPRRTSSPPASMPWSVASRARKTVLQSMVEEFGLSPT